MSTTVATSTASVGNETIVAADGIKPRRSSASSSTSDLHDHDAPVMPYDNAAQQTLTMAPSKPMNLTIDATESSSSTTTTPPIIVPSLALGLQSPTSTGATFTFEEIMSPRHQNGKRYLGGYLQHRVSMAGGFLKSWKRKYFRLRDHGIVCFKQDDDTTPLFEVIFKTQSILVVDKPSPLGAQNTDKDQHDGVTNNSDHHIPTAVAKGKVNASLLLILKHIEVQGHETPASKVDVPVYLKAENETEFYAWVENLRLKMDARKRALAMESVSAVLNDDGMPSTRPWQTAHDVNDVKTSTTSRPDTERGRCDSMSYSERREPVDVDDTMGNTTEPQRSMSMKSIVPVGLSSSVGSSSTTTTGATATPASARGTIALGAPSDPPDFTTFRTKYLLMKEIGEGSFSIVHRAVNRLTGSLVAVKCCKYSAALEEEVSLLQKLQHPNIIGLDAVYQQDEMHYVVMDYMGDGDLCERLIKQQRLSERDVKKIITQVAQGVEYLHRHAILHRDLKPENILLHGNVVKIADFGLARQLPNATSMLKRSCGTLEYAAPELLCGKAYGLKSDIFSLGVVLYVLLFGAFPFSIESAAALQRMERFPEGVDVRDMSCLYRENAPQWTQVTKEAKDVLLKMLCVNEKDRISAKELLHHPWFTGMPLSTVSASPTSSPTNSSTKRKSSFFSSHSRTASFKGSTTSDVQRSVSHSTTELIGIDMTGEEQARIADCRAKGFVELLSRGLDVIKYGKSGGNRRAPHLTTLSIDFVHSTITWTARGGVLGLGGGTRSTSHRQVTDHASSSSSATVNKRNPTSGSRVISIADVLEIRVGHATDAFGLSSGAIMPAPELCFSIVCTWRTLDIAVKAPSQRVYLVEGLMRLKEQYVLKHKPQDETTEVTIVQ